MRLDDFLKTVDSSTQLVIDLVTNEQELPLIVSGTKQEAIPSLISQDIYNLDIYDIYLKENQAWT